MMHPLSLFPVLSLLVLPLPTFTIPTCNAALYGTPPYQDCQDIFFSRPGNKGLSSLDKKSHFFGAIGSPSRRPHDVLWKEWGMRVDLPRTWHDHECSALLSPNLHPNGQPMYDIGTYADIAEGATSILFECLTPATLPLGLLEGGSFDAVGVHYRLTLILYHPLSRFADVVRADVAAGRIMDYASINIAGPTSQNTNPFLGPTEEKPVEGSQAESSSSGSRQRTRPAAAAQCERSPYCSRATDCRSEGCKCVADKGIEWWSSSCRMPLADLASGAGRGLLESGSNITALASASSNSSTTDVEGTRNSNSDAVTRYLSNLACPCNCTYISRKCCVSESGVVHEHSMFRLGGLKAPTEQMECDESNGNWRERD
ncbi:hypothetical protein G7Y79_00011g030990 [Physcia stellaris]|nr:hypothetical protein G7Y79_00011g030990 [Physcia stellaris]